jgi:isopentenyl diphosphate isomerase/L-lactate dehydrogenase-like FMN-dependent dehydrogenase
MFGHEFDTPICISSISHLGKFGYGENGMVAAAKAAEKCNALNFCGWGSDEELKAIVETGAKTIKIVKPLADMDELLRTVKYAEEVGCIAIGMDIDHIFNMNGDYDNVDGIPLSAKTEDDLKRIIGSTKLPFVIKGVLSVQDAEKAVNAGAAAIFVSHHHGLFKCMTPPPMVLPEISAAVQGKVPIFIDGNIESGYDAFKALALGGTMTAVGRPFLKLIRDRGEDGVAAWITHNTQQLRGVMSRSGCSKVSDISIKNIRKAGHSF